MTSRTELLNDRIDPQSTHRRCSHLSLTMDVCRNFSADGTGGETVAAQNHHGRQPEMNFTDVINQFVLPAVCVFGIVGNLLNLAILTRRKLQKSFRTLEQSANLCLISLALSDLMFCVSAFLTIFAPPGDTFEERGILLTYSTYCATIINVFIMESTLLTVAMSLERYLAICFPLRQDIYLTTRRIKYIIVFTFLFSMCINIPVLWRYEVVVICQGNFSDLHQTVNGTSLNLTSMSGSNMGLNSKLGVGGAGEGSILTFLLNTTDIISADTVGLNTNNKNVSSLLALSSIVGQSSLHSSFPSSSAAASPGPLPSPSSSSSSSISSSPSSTPLSSPGANRNSPKILYTTEIVLLGGSTVYDTTYRIVWAVVGNFIPLILLFYFNVCLCRKIYRSYKLRKNLGRQGQPRSSSHILTITLVAIVVLFFILVTPSEVALLVSHMSSRGSTPMYQNIEAVFNLMQSINFSVNFILYCIISPHFRKTLKYMVLCGCYNIYQKSRDWKKEFETSLM